MNMRFVWGALLTTAMVLGVIFILNRWSVTKGLVQAALT